MHVRKSKYSFLFALQHLYMYLNLNIEIILKLYDSIANIWAILKVENIAYTD